MTWSENKKRIPQMAIIKVQVPEGVAITTDEKEDGFFVPTADLDKVKIEALMASPFQRTGCGVCTRGWSLRQGL
jgi:hypothetical protein